MALGLVSTDACMHMDGVKAVKRHNAQHDLFNRLHSIAADQAFVRQVAEGWYGARFEVVPNQRCGTWYCPPSVGLFTADSLRRGLI